MQYFMLFFHIFYSQWLLTILNCRRYYFASPDDEAFRFMSSIYSRSHRNMSLSKEFEGGITNGAAWYDSFEVNPL